MTSPLVYICVADALHAGWKKNPLYVSETGYSFSNDPATVVASTGYADDAMIYATVWADLWMMHQWSLEFCRAHGFKISPKTKYFISSYEGKADPRWLPGQDGQKILPQAPDTEFRYLGAYISLCLISKKQIQMINNTIMNWRWRALAQKIDPAMLANTVTEYLLPKIELGLLFAYGISDQMCRSWTRTIIDTLAATANMTKTITRLMSIEATCCLAGIPDIGLRMQTLRITEFFLLINSSNCISGKTTLARLCALKHKSSAQMEQVLQQLFDKDREQTR